MAAEFKLSPELIRTFKSRHLCFARASGKTATSSFDPLESLSFPRWTPHAKAIQAPRRAARGSQGK
jgi:hypothetical protein